jgi:hypothetical protein
MGFPAETFEIAVRPLLDAYADHVKQTSALPRQCGAESDPSVRRALVIALRAVDHRRGHILPRNAPPETVGALGHRWTYAVFAAALLHELAPEGEEVPAQLLERGVSPQVLAWLGDDPALWMELRAVLGGRPPRDSAIAALVAQAASRSWPRREVPADVNVPTVTAAAVIERVVASQPASMADDADAFLAAVDRDPTAPARRFMAWLQQRIGEGRLTVNARGALAHGVAEGLLLVSPSIFKACVEDGPRSAGDVGDDAKRLQRDVLRAGWHVRTQTGGSLLRYTWLHEAGDVAAVQGIVIVAPERFLAPAPGVNPALVRHVSAAAVR